MLSRLMIVFLAAAALVQFARSQVIETSDKEDSTGMPRVVFYRPWISQRRGYLVDVYCDLTKVARMPDKAYFEIALSPGGHVCTTEAKNKKDDEIGDGYGGVMFVSEDLTIEVKSGDKQWVAIRFKNAGWFHFTYRLVLEDPEHARKTMTHDKIQQLPPDKQFIRSIRRTPVGQASTSND